MNTFRRQKSQQHLYSVTVESKIHTNRPFPDRIELTFTAKQPGSPDKIWQASRDLVDDLFALVLTARESAEVVARLRDGEAVSLPHYYTSGQLVELGFRACFQKPESSPAEKRRWAPNDYIAFR